MAAVSSWIPSPVAPKDFTFLTSGKAATPPVVGSNPVDKIPEKKITPGDSAKLVCRPPTTNVVSANDLIAVAPVSPPLQRSKLDIPRKTIAAQKKALGSNVCLERDSLMGILQWLRTIQSLIPGS